MLSVEKEIFQQVKTCLKDYRVSKKKEIDEVYSLCLEEFNEQRYQGFGINVSIEKTYIFLNNLLIRRYGINKMKNRYLYILLCSLIISFFVLIEFVVGVLLWKNDISSVFRNLYIVEFFVALIILIYTFLTFYKRHLHDIIIVIIGFICICIGTNQIITSISNSAPIDIEYQLYYRLFGLIEQSKFKIYNENELVLQYSTFLFDPTHIYTLFSLVFYYLKYNDFKSIKKENK